MSPREIAEAALQQQLRLQQDAAKRRDAAASARAEAESSASAAEEAHAKALAASAAKRSDDKLADAAGRASVRLAHAREDQRSAVEAHEKSTSDVDAAEGRVAAAKRDLEREQVLAELNDPATDEELRAHGAACADAVAVLLERVRAARAILREDSSRVQRARSLGAVDVVLRDGVTAAAGWLGALAKHGGALANGQETHDHRFAFMLPLSGVDADGIAAARSLVGIGTGVIEQGRLFDRRGIGYGRQRLETVAASFAGHRSFRTAREAITETDRQTAAARAEEHRVAHEARLVQRQPDIRDVTFPEEASGLPPNPLLDPPEGQETDDLKV
jgi:hypothetical protein